MGVAKKLGTEPSKLFIDTPNAMIKCEYRKYASRKFLIRHNCAKCFEKQQLNSWNKIDKFANQQKKIVRLVDINHVQKSRKLREARN